eukprot:CAMPEP_0168555066 /NCGR_PEP_ID=MMETSP0413-20121227/8125_1 /TAXON_ID=136452 /ORGANISM="Filamoeba nolandi, Strain NC-AS-23-1" /LENGTH=226 /DNA_ID=CAMNT_0008585869 /DNA_START=51 /DNA_END=731 /DNA_ORIENTATION=+
MTPTTVLLPKELIPQDETAKHDWVIKVAIVGESGVGKSSLILKFTENTFIDGFISTIGADFKSKSVKLNVNNTDKIAKLQLWDTAGQERFRSFTTSFYRGSGAFMIVFDIADEVSFQKVAYWLQDIRRYANLDSVPLFLVGTKLDLNDKRQVSSETATKYAEDHGMIYMETSSKSGLGINELFFTAAQKTVQKVIEKQEENNINTFKATSPPPKKRKSMSRGCTIV